MDVSEREIRPDLLRARYPKIENPEFYYHILCKMLTGKSEEIAWRELTPEQWDLLEAVAESEQVSAVLYWLWKDTQPPRLPYETFIRMGMSFIANYERQKNVLVELDECVLPALEAKVSPVVFLKGEALAYSVYPHPALRPMGDLDLLVPKNQQAEAARSLQAIGYREETEPRGPMTQELGKQHHIHLFSPKPVPLIIEVHRNIINSQASYASDPDIDWYWHNLEKFSIGEDQQAYCLNPTAQLLHLAIHLALQHGEAQMSLLKYYDIHLLVEKQAQQIDWQELACQAKAQQRTAALYAALKGCISRFGTDIDPKFLTELAPHIEENLIGEEVRLKSRPESIGSLAKISSIAVWLNLRAPQPFAGRVLYIKEMLFPSPRFLRYRYHPRPVWLWPVYYLVRWWQAAVYSWRWLKILLMKY